MRSNKTKERIENQTRLLTLHFDDYVAEFNRLNLFTGPSVYFHRKTIEILNQYSSAVEALYDTSYLEYLYATLTAWGMHRMGEGNTKLADLEDIKDSFQTQTDEIKKIQHTKIDEIPKDEVKEVTSKIWAIIKNLNIGIGETKIVAGSKALHHLLPELVPPIDGEYTLNFFYGSRGTALNQGDEVAFKEIYPQFSKISKECKSNIENHMNKGLMATSKTKLIDNAIVGCRKVRLEEDYRIK